MFTQLWLHFLSRFFARQLSELEAQLDYERLRREKLEAQLDEFRRENNYLQSMVSEQTHTAHSPVSHSDILKLRARNF